MRYRIDNPEIVFQSAGVTTSRVAESRYRVRITGELTLRSASREIAIDLTATLEGDRLRAQGELPLRLTDFDIRPISVAGGLLKLKDEVHLSFDILAAARHADHRGFGEDRRRNGSVVRGADLRASPARHC